MEKESAPKQNALGLNPALSAHAGRGRLAGTGRGSCSCQRENDGNLITQASYCCCLDVLRLRRVETCSPTFISANQNISFLMVA